MVNTPGRIKGRTPASLKDAYSQLVDACGGDVRAALIAQKGKSQIQRYTDEGEPDYQMPASVAIALEASCGDPIVTRYMALATNHVLLNTTAKTDAPLAQDLATVGREMARLFEEVGGALADGAIAPAEAALIEARAMDGVNALVSVIAETRRIRKDGGA
jgi:hypothetical protein